MKTISISIDVEPDINNQTYDGVINGLPLLLNILKKYNIKATFFVTCDCIKKFPGIFRKMKKLGHEIALHGYTHKRLDELNYEQKEEQINKSLICFKKYLNLIPIGFR